MDLIVAGAGWAGERHVGAARTLERAGADVHVAALVDVDREHLEQQAAALDVAAASSPAAAPEVSSCSASSSSLPAAAAIRAAASFTP